MRKYTPLTKYTVEEKSHNSPVHPLVHLDFPIMSKLQLREAFSCVHQSLGYSILASRRGFPTYTLRDSTGNPKDAEIVRQPWDFIEQDKPLGRCDLLICWEDVSGIGKKMKEQYGMELLELRAYVDALYSHSLTSNIGKRRHAYHRFQVETSLFKWVYLQGMQGKQQLTCSLEDLQMFSHQRGMIKLPRQLFSNCLETLHAVHDYPFHQKDTGEWVINILKMEKLANKRFYAKAIRDYIFDFFVGKKVIKAEPESYPLLPWDASERQRFLLSQNLEKFLLQEQPPKVEHGTEDQNFSLHQPQNRIASTQLNIHFPVTHEINVREVFCLISQELEYTILQSRSEFPDYVVEDREGKKIRAEVEVRPVNFRTHEHPVDECDLLICWMNDHYGRKLSNQGIDIFVLEKLVAAPSLDVVSPQSSPIATRQTIQTRRRIGTHILEVLARKHRHHRGMLSITLKELQKTLKKQFEKEMTCTSILNYLKFDTAINFLKKPLPFGVCLYFTPQEIEKVKKKLKGEEHTSNFPSPEE